MLYVLCTAVVFPYWDKLAETSGNIQMQTKRLTNYRKILRGQDTVRAALEETQRQLSTAEKGLLANRSDSLAAAEFQGLIKQMSIAQGLNLLRTEVLPAKPVSAEYAKLSARLEFSGPIDRLVNLLASFDSGERILCVEEMRISPTQISNPKKKDVRVTMTVSALKNAAPSVSPPAAKR
jgi:Tfp pilus assembly protein PilO